MRASPSRSTWPPSSAIASRRWRRAACPLFITQSGETADTLATLRYCKAQGQRIASIVNVRTSTIARESDVVLPTLAGPEIGVASTKAFTCQLSVLACLAIALGRARGAISEAQEKELTHALAEVPRHVSTLLHNEAQYERLAHELSKARDVLYLGRGISYPLALEGALKLKEISYIHAEGYAAGELKHGPIALIDENVPVIVVAPADELFEKTVSNMQEVAARGGKIVLLSDAPAERAGCALEAHIRLPTVHPFVSPLLYAVPVQLHRLPHGGVHGHRRGPAAQPCQIGDCGIGHEPRRCICLTRAMWHRLMSGGCSAFDATSTGGNTMTGDWRRLALAASAATAVAFACVTHVQAQAPAPAPPRRPAEGARQGSRCPRTPKTARPAPRNPRRRSDRIPPRRRPQSTRP